MSYYLYFSECPRCKYWIHLDSKEILLNGKLWWKCACCGNIYLDKESETSKFITDNLEKSKLLWFEKQLEKLKLGED